MEERARQVAGWQEMEGRRERERDEEEEGYMRERGRMSPVSGRFSRQAAGRQKGRKCHTVGHMPMPAMLHLSVCLCATEIDTARTFPKL